MALLFQYKVLIQYWGECLLTATYVRMLSRSIGFMSPYKRLFSHNPYINHGCLYYVSTSTVKRSKFDPKATPCVFIEYPTSQKAYKILNLLTNKIIVSRDITFYENYFSFQFSSNHASTYPIKLFLPITTFLTSFDMKHIWTHILMSLLHLFLFLLLMQILLLHLIYKFYLYKFFFLIFLIFYKFFSTFSSYHHNSYS